MNTKILFWLLVITTGAINAVMIGWSLPKIATDAGGLWPFDLQLAGYTFEEAKDFLTALSSEGNDFYRNVQQRLDNYFPALLALTLGAAIFLLAPNFEKRKRLLLALIPLPGMIFDYLENARVGEMLLAGANGITPKMVELASFYSRLKSAYVTLAFVVLFILVIKWFMHRRQQGF